MRQLLIHLLLILLLPALHAQQVFNLNGQVLEQASNKPVKGRVLLYQQQAQQPDTIFTDRNGQYRLLLQRNTSYRYHIQADGYTELVGTLLIGSEARQPKTKLHYLQPSTDQQLEAPDTAAPFVLDKVLFSLGRAEILPGADYQLDSLVQHMQQHPELKLFIEGHTDYAGDPKKNIELSDARVKAVKNYLVKQGIKKRRISGKGFGGSKPVYRGRNRNERAANRRVEVYFMEQKQ
jgi:outer membrane protein OmpA-like peptidoglycan-associated protein